DATARNLTGAINALIEKAGLRIVAQKRIRMTREQAETFYAVHKARPFFGELVDFMTSGPVVVQVLEGENAVLRYREVMGATDPSKAAEGSIRKLHARSIGENSVHGSDAPETAAVEIAQFFSGNEIVGGSRRPAPGRGSLVNTLLQIFDPANVGAFFTQFRADMQQPSFWISVGKIIWINVLLSGDNALVIAMACRGLHGAHRLWGMVIGAGIAVGLLIAFTGIVARLMALPYLK